MRVLDWLKRSSGAEEAMYHHRAGDLDIEPGREEAAGLDFKTAIDAHIHWKDRLKDAIDGVSGEHLDAGLIGRDDQCTLGKWIYGEGGRHYRGQYEFEQLRAHHAAFHHAAADVLRTVQHGDVEEAEKMLNDGAYHRESLEVTLSLAKLYAMFSSM